MVGSSARASCGELGGFESGGVEFWAGRSTGGDAGMSTRAGGGGGRTGATSATRGDGEGAGAGGADDVIGGRGTDATGGGAEGASGAGAGSSATGGAGGAGRPVAPGMKEKSSASEDEIHGTCSPREARVTPTRVRLSVSSAIRSGTRISLSNSWTNRLWSPPLSDMTELSAAEYITSVPFGAMTGARPAEKLRKRRSYGLRRDASMSAILTP